MMYEYIQVAVRKNDMKKVLDFLKKDYPEYSWEADNEYDEIRGSKEIGSDEEEGTPEFLLEHDIKEQLGVNVTVVEEIEMVED